MTNLDQGCQKQTEGHWSVFGKPLFHPAWLEVPPWRAVTDMRCGITTANIDRTMTSPKEETYEFDSQLSSARQTGSSGRSVMATCNQYVSLFTVNEHDGSGNDWPTQSLVYFAWMNAHKPKTPRVSLKLNIITAGWWMVRIILGVFLNSRHRHAIFQSRGVTRYTKPRIHFWVCRLDLFFLSTGLNSEKHVSAFMGTPVPATRPHPALRLRGSEMCRRGSMLLPSSTFAHN